MHEQIKRTLMGSPVSGFLDEAIMQVLENIVLCIVNHLVRLCKMQTSEHLNVKYTRKEGRLRESEQ